jgi:Flp pilus assembly pilin Flp
MSNFSHHPHHPAVRRSRRERGASLVEYALMVALIAVACISAVFYFGGSTDTGLNKSKDCISAAYDGQTLEGKCR